MERVFKESVTAPRAQRGERPSRDAAEAAVRTLIAWAGDDPDRDGLKDTPHRVTAAYGELFSGYDEDAALPLERTFEEVGAHDGIVVVRDIPFFSHCEHHMMPFVGKAHVAYYPAYPAEEVVGLPKLARVVKVFAHRLQTQERLTLELTGAIEKALKPRGVALMLEAEHRCMTLRGVRAHGASTVTTQFTGAFRDDPGEQIRFMTLVKGGSQCT